MSRILIAGCGDLGTVLGLRLAGAGHAVWGLRRQPQCLPGPLQRIAADLAEPATLGDLPRDLDAVYYTAAASDFSEAAYREAYVTGVENLLAALAAQGGPGRMIFVSSTGVYAQAAGERVDEDSPSEPRYFSGRALLAGERRVLAAPCTAVVLRLAGIYGPGRERLIRQVRAGEPCAAEPPVYTNRIHRDDCAGVLAHLLDLDHPGSIYLGVDHVPAPQCEVMDWIAGRLGLPPPPRLPAGGGSPRRGSKRCSNRRLLASGYRFRYPSYREGYAALLQQA